jgi:hypothetical protein
LKDRRVSQSLNDVPLHHPLRSIVMSGECGRINARIIRGALQMEQQDF